MGRRLLCVPPFPGELGWEIINYIPYINGIRKSGKFDAVVACVRVGRERLYPFVERFVPSYLVEDVQVSGNCGPKSNAYVSEMGELKGRIRKMTGKGHKCTFLRCNRIKASMLLPGRSFLCYKATTEEIKSCHAKYGSKYAVILVRTRRFGRGKNWSIANFDKLGRKIKALGFVPVYVGSGASIKFSCGVNLIGKTKVNDLIPILCGASFAIGGSTGTMHLASMCGTPHVVWGNKRLIKRYIKQWNPHGTNVSFISEFGWKPQVSCVVSEFKKFMSLA